MKRTYKLILAALGATVALMACTKEPTPAQTDQTPAAEGLRTMAVSFGNATKTAFSNTEGGIEPYFVDGDKILVANGQDEPDTCIVSVKYGKATISTNLTGTLNAVYPATAARMDEQNPKAIVGVLVSTEQDGTFANANICMAEDIPEDAKEVTFKNKIALFRIIPVAGAQYVDVKAADGYDIANCYTDESAYTDIQQIHVAPITADTVYVSLLFPSGLKIGDLTFSDGNNEKTFTGDKASTEIEAGALYTVTNEGWEPEYVVMNMGTGQDAYTLKWATKNIGASKPTDYGYFFSWGNTNGYVYDSTNKWVRASDNTQLGTDGIFSQFNYSSSPGNDLSEDISPAGGNDAARINWGGDWRMPTAQEFQDLYDACINGSYDKSTKPTGASASVGKGVYWCTSYDGVVGCLFCDGNNRLFFPAAGYGDGEKEKEPFLAGEKGFYWSSSYYADGDGPSYYVYNLSFYCSDVGYPRATYNRWCGFPVRPVSDL